MTAGPSGIGVVFQNVTKQYGKMTAVDGVSLDIRCWGHQAPARQRCS